MGNPPEATQIYQIPNFPEPRFFDSWPWELAEDSQIGWFREEEVTVAAPDSFSGLLGGVHGRWFWIQGEPDHFSPAPPSGERRRLFPFVSRFAFDSGAYPGWPAAIFFCAIGRAAGARGR